LELWSPGGRDAVFILPRSHKFLSPFFGFCSADLYRHHVHSVARGRASSPLHAPTFFFFFFPPLPFHQNILVPFLLLFLFGAVITPPPIHYKVVCGLYRATFLALPPPFCFVSILSVPAFPPFPVEPASSTLCQALAQVDSSPPSLPFRLESPLSFPTVV